MSIPIMILAAGLGTRLRPLTLERPKPLVEVARKALIDHVLDMVLPLAPPFLIVNIHAHADQMVEHLRARLGDKVIISDERAQLLDSGGGIAKGFLEHTAPRMLTLNSDVFWIEGAKGLRGLLAHDQRHAACQENHISMLLGHVSEGTGYDGIGDFSLDKNQQVVRRLPEEHAEYVFLGAQIVPRRLCVPRAGEAFSVREIWEPLMKTGQLSGTVHPSKWFHVGTVPSLQATENILNSKLLDET